MLPGASEATPGGFAGKLQSAKDGHAGLQHYIETVISLGLIVGQRDALSNSGDTAVIQGAIKRLEVQGRKGKKKGTKAQSRERKETEGKGDGEAGCYPGGIGYTEADYDCCKKQPGQFGGRTSNVNGQ